MAVTKRIAYAEQQFDRLSGLDGISDEQIREHLILYAGYVQPLLVMDVWEHAFMRDYKATERAKYVDAFFKNVDWSTVDQRLREAATVRSAA